MTPVASGEPGWRAWGRWLWGVVPPFLLLNALLTFENRWPGIGIRLGQRLSFELCLGVLALLAWCAWRGGLGARARHALALLVAALVLLRYADVTAQAMLSRPLNLQWDAPHAWQLLRLAAGGLTPWQLAAALAAALGALVAMHAGAAWAIGRLARHLVWPRPRPWLWAAGVGLTLSWAAHPFVERDTRWFFSLPLAPTLAREAVRLPASVAPRLADARLGPGPAFDGDLAALRGADVVIVFAEAYGATAFDDAGHARALAPARDALAAAIVAGGRHVVTARVRSPTFGGSSWLAHAALLGGVDTADPLQHDLLLASERPTLVSHFAVHGWRTVAWMPGLQRPWPEGRFYRFERLAPLAEIGYRGAAFGYWHVPDEAAIALLQAQELGPAAKAVDPRPRFVIFPNVSSHAPFRPLPPLLGDWERATRPDAYTPAQAVAALAAPVSWVDASDAYRDAMAYVFGWLGGWLRELAPADAVVIVIGDHQPIAAVTGAGASWDVPVHVIARDRALLRRFEEAGFVPGLTLPAAAWGPMHALTSLLLRVATDGAAVAEVVPPPRAP